MAVIWSLSRQRSWLVSAAVLVGVAPGRLGDVDVRTGTSPALVSVRGWLDRVNRRRPWNHNEHFHGWVLRNLPARRGGALDVGCGTGVLVQKLARHFAHVTGIDADGGMTAAASKRVAAEPRVSIRQRRFEEFTASVGPAGGQWPQAVVLPVHPSLGQATLTP